MSLLDWIMVAITALFAFLAGLIAVQFLQLFQVGSFLIAVILFAVVVALFAGIWVSDRVFSRQDAPKASRRATLQAFAAGLTLAFIATRIWTPEQITGLY